MTKPTLFGPPRRKRGQQVLRDVGLEIETIIKGLQKGPVVTSFHNIVFNDKLNELTPMTRGKGRKGKNVTKFFLVHASI